MTNNNKYKHVLTGLPHRCYHPPHKLMIELPQKTRLNKIAITATTFISRLMHIARHEMVALISLPESQTKWQMPHNTPTFRLIIPYMVIVN